MSLSSPLSVFETGFHQVIQAHIELTQGLGRPGVHDPAALVSQVTEITVLQHWVRGRTVVLKLTHEFVIDSGWKYSIKQIAGLRDKHATQHRMMGLKMRQRLLTSELPQEYFRIIYNSCII